MTDAHVHIVPESLLGTTDGRFGITVMPYGKKTGNGMDIQFMPPYFADSAFTAETLIYCMDYYGVKNAVIMQSLCSASNEETARAVEAWPERLRGAMVIEPGNETCLDAMRYWHSRGLSIMKFETSEGLGYTNPRAYPDMRFDSPLFVKIFALASGLGLTVAIDPSRIGTKCYTPDAIGVMARMYPELRFVICHLGFPYAGLKEEHTKYALWKRMTALAALPNVWFDVAAMPDLFAAEGYPYPSAAAFLREFLNLYPGKAIWGSDIPGTLIGAAYSQMQDMFTRSGLFSPDELLSLYIGAAAEAYSLE